MSKNIIIFLNPELLETKLGVEHLRDYITNNAVTPYSVFAEYEDDHLVVIPKNPSESIISYDRKNILAGYWKMTLDSLLCFLRIGM